ncbi:MAG: flagellin [Phycisphaerales bacterium]|nr:MAG: flagellin [Phycisphaerales bacterium]
MTRINTNVQSLIAQRVLGQNNFQLNTSLERLSTGLRINRGKDDPAGLIASENLRSEIRSTNAAISNAERADQVLNIAEGGLQEVSGLLVELQGLLTATASKAGLSKEEQDANQVQIDSILQTIDRIAGQTNFQGVKLLNGNFDYQTSAVNASVSQFQVNGAKFKGDSMNVDVNITTSAQRGQLFMDLGATGSLDMNNTGSAFTIEISGALGSRQLQFSSGTSFAAIQDAINTFSDVTGVVASAEGNGIKLLSSEFGSSNFVSLKVVNEGNVQGGGIMKYESGDANTLSTDPNDITAFGAANNGVRDRGQDVVANINGVAATANGRTISVNSDMLDVRINLTESSATQLSSFTAFQITGGGADFQLGSRVDIEGKVSLGISDVNSRKLGSIEDADNIGRFFNLSDLGSGRSLNVVDGDIGVAQDVVGKAINEVASLRGRLGAFQSNTIGATMRSLAIAVENTEAAQSVIRDADFASETAALTRSQILSQASINTLSLANQSPQNALALLG